MWETTCNYCTSLLPYLEVATFTLFAFVLVSLAGVASIFLGLGKNSGACWFSGILLTGMLALTSPFMNCSSAPNKIMMLALRFSYRLCFLSKVYNGCMWVLWLCKLHLNGGFFLLAFKCFKLRIMFDIPFCLKYVIVLHPE
jgi:hypothetical protein